MDAPAPREPRPAGGGPPPANPGRMWGRGATAVAVLLAGAAWAPPARAAAARDVAALQVALRADGLYAGDVDGIAGPGTAAAVRVLQRRRGLAVDGIAGPRTRAALGRRGRPPYGSRPLRRGAAGWDVAALQFELARHGFPSGPLDGGFGPRVEAAVARFQAHAGLTPDGVAGPATIAALRAPPPRSPLALTWPLRAPVTDGFGARGARWHTGLDLPAAFGRVVVAPRAGRVAGTGDAGDGYGLRVTLDHGGGVRTRSAHLSAALVAPGAWVAAGAPIGRVGATGAATGPHLHFEVIVRGALADPLPALSGG